jgi:hypothetical protein
MIDPHELISANEAAQLLHLEPSTLADWRCDDKGPAYIRLGKRIFYRRADISTWIGQQRHEPRRAARQPAMAEA